MIPYEDKAAFAGNFMKQFLKGYREENELGDEWLASISDFLRLRHILLYGLFHQAFDLATIGEEEKAMLASFRSDIEAATPITTFDFTKLSQS